MFFDYHKKRKRRIHGLSFDTSHYVHKRHRRKEKRTGWKTAAIVLSVLVFLAAGGTGAFYYLRFSGKGSLKQAANTTAPQMEEEQEGLLYRDGKKYRYNENIVTLLCMGIDTESDLSEVKEVSGESGQADTIFLLVLNPDTRKMKLIGISRDTMTNIHTYDHYGNYIGESKNHLGLAYAFGDGGKKSGEMMVDAVSELFYDLPLHGWCAVNLNAIEKLNNAVGGVNVTLSEDMTLGTRSYSKGENVLLTGAEAESFVRHREMDAEGSNNLRMNRQKQYAVSFFRSAKAALKKDVTLATSLYKDLKDEMATSISLDEAVYLVTEISGMSLDLDEIQMLKGTTKQGSVYEEFYVDEEALKDVIFDTFYIEVK